MWTVIFGWLVYFEIFSLTVIVYNTSIIFLYGVGGKESRKSEMMQRLAQMDPEFVMQKSVRPSFTSYTRTIISLFSSVTQTKIAGNSTIVRKVTIIIRIFVTVS